MKKSIILLSTLAVMLCLTIGCSKQRNCRCIATQKPTNTTIYSDTVHITIKGKTKCEDITAVGDEWLQMSDDYGFGNATNRVNCEEE